MTRSAFARLIHSDWSTTPNKRWAVEARNMSSGWLVEAPRPVGRIEEFLSDLLGSPQPTLAGFDFPIGIPAAHARRAKVSRFTEVLEVLGAGEWSEFYRVCDRENEISLHRPFYPRVSSSIARQAHLVEALGFDDIDALKRACERKTETRKAACSLFWTLGGNQVGKAAISGWQSVVQPARREGALIWPFDGGLEALSKANHLVICETYPAEAYGHVDVRFPPRASKQRQSDRRAAIVSLLSRSSKHGIRFSDAMRDALVDGFGPLKSGEDPFDAALGLLGMIEVAEGRRPATPTSVEAVDCEGWILGQAA
jgi:hypothetical protein